jgi:hypothetical protein
MTCILCDGPLGARNASGLCLHCTQHKPRAIDGKSQARAKANREAREAKHRARVTAKYLPLVRDCE